MIMMMKVTRFLLDIYSMTSVKRHRCEPEGSCSSVSWASSSDSTGMKTRSFGRSPRAVHPVPHPVQGVAYPCGCKDICTCSDLCSDLCSVNLSTVQPPDMIFNSTTLVPGKVHGATEGKKSEPVLKPQGILKPGFSCIIRQEHVPGLPLECESTLATPRYDLKSRDLDDYVSAELITARSSELTRDLTRASTSQGRLSSVPATNPSATQDRGSSSSNQSGIRGVEYSLSLSRDNSPVQTKSIEDRTIMQRGMQELRVAFETKTRGNPPSPPPPCSHCNNAHHLGYCMPSKRFSLEELKDVTDFSLDNKFNGSMDDDLYRGELDGRPVFVARKETKSEPSDYFPEVDILKSIRHPHIVTLRAYCDEDNSRALVFNFVCNGTLFYHLSSGNPNTMQWPHRANLAVKLAKGLNYLHDRHIIHGNVNTKNIFVTHDFQPVIGEFSFSRYVDGDRDVILQNRKDDKEARGYLPPEYQLEYEAGRKLSEKVDIYAFGVILFELVCGRAAFDRSLDRSLDRKNKTNHYLGEWGRENVKKFQQNDPWELVDTMADSRLKGSDYNKDEMLRMIKAAALCTSKDPKGRPPISVVVEMLTGEKDTKSEQKLQVLPSQAPPSPAPHTPSAPSPVVPRGPYWADEDTLVMETAPTSPLSPSPGLSRQPYWADQDTPVMETGSSEPSAPSPAVPERSYCAGQDTLVIKIGGAMRSTYNDQNPAEILQLLRDQAQTEKCRALNHNIERAPQVQKLPETSFSRISHSASKPPVTPASNPNPKSATKAGPAKTARFAPFPAWNNSQRRPQTPGHELLKKNRSSDTHHPGSGSSTGTQFGRSPKNSSSKKGSQHSSTVRRISMSPRRHKVTISWYNRKSGGANFANRAERKEHRVTWKRRPRPTFWNFHFTFNDPD